MARELPETIEVRPDERFDVDRLLEWLDGRLPGSHRPVTVSQFSRGKANLTYLLDFGDGDEYVLRRPPLGPIAPGAHDMAREYPGVVDAVEGVSPGSPRLCLLR